MSDRLADTPTAPRSTMHKMCAAFIGTQWRPLQVLEKLGAGTLVSWKLSLGFLVAILLGKSAMCVLDSASVGNPCGLRCASLCKSVKVWDLVKPVCGCWWQMGVWITHHHRHRHRTGLIVILESTIHHPYHHIHHACIHSIV